MYRSHVEIAIGADPSAFDSFIGVMAGDGFQGFWEDGDFLRAYIPKEDWDESCLDALSEKLRRITSVLSLPPPSLSVKVIREQNWNQAWEATIRPIHATARIVITPTWHRYEGLPGEIVLTIDPKMSFGTGYHETTRLMLELIERNIRPGAKFLDAGTGTGVLAIAALKLGAGSAVGIDTDEWSFDNAMENGKLNGVSEFLSIRQGDLSVVGETGFDLIAANIQKNVIEEMIPGFASRLAPGGVLLVSGLLAADRGDMLTSLHAAGLTAVEERHANEWIGLAARLALP